MFQPLKSLFNKSPSLNSEVDVRYFIQNFLRTQLKSDALYCDKVANSVATVRVDTPAQQQAVVLLEYDIIDALQREMGYKLKAIKVRIE